MSATMDLRDVLAFYANPDNYAFNTEGEIGPNVILDGGSKARMILDDAEELGPPPLQAAALAALVAWREAARALDATRTAEAGREAGYRFGQATGALRAAADAMLAAEGGRGG